MLGADEAIARISKCLETVRDTRESDVWEALGMVLAEPVKAPWDFPPRPRAGYDGYAVRSQDTPGKLRLAGVSPIGSEPPRLAEKEAVYVTTGAYMPEGADALVPQEEVELLEEHGENYVLISRRVEKWYYVDTVGYHVKRGQVLLEEGRVLTALDAAALLSVAITRVKTRRKIRVAVLSLGSELVPRLPTVEPRQLLSGLVVETNSMILRWMLERRAPFAEIVCHRIVGDDPRKINDAMREAMSKSDVVVSFGGSGPSSIDYAGLAVKSFECFVDSVKIKPGRPAKLAAVGGKLLAVMPGHPVSAFHALTRLLYPLLVRIAGARSVEWPRVKARLAGPLRERKKGFSQQYLVSLRPADGGLEAVPIYKHGAGVTSKMAGVDGFIELCETCDASEGSEVDVYLIG